MRNQNSHNQQQNPDGEAENNEELSAIGANVLALLPHSIPPAARSSEASVATNSNGAGSESSIQRVSREDTRLPPHHLGWPPSVQMAGLIECENRMFAGTLKQYFEGAQPNPVAAATKGKEQAHAPTACGSSNALDKLARAGEFNILDMNLTFPVKLHMLLSYPACRDYLRWSSHGRAWIITKPKEFEAHVLPKFFRSVKMASFMRQVNGWAFSRITEGSDNNAYWHPLFLRGLPNLAGKMKRPPKEKNSAAVARSSTGVSGVESPNFSLISKFAPLPACVPYKINTGGRIQFLDEAVARQSENDILELENDSEFLEGMKAIDWATPQFLEKNPFDSDSGSSGKSCTNNSLDETQSPQSKNLGATATGMESLTLEASAVEDTPRRLSESDLRYMANQNRYLLMYAASSQCDTSER